jgi:RNA polymerase sigma-70 factor (ECF subfamily)
LLRRVREQAPGSWERLTNLYCPLVYGWARRAGLEAEDAADVVQEVFLAVVTHLPNFRHGGAGDTFRGWLWTITQNKVRDLARRRADRAVAAGGTDALERLLALPNLSASEGSAGFPPHGSLLARALELIRSEFEERTWQAFWSVVVEERLPADVATALQISVNAVYIARSRVLRRLREELNDLPGE